jgi:hypothetical protein
VNSFDKIETNLKLISQGISMTHSYDYIRRWREAHPQQLKEHKKRSNRRAYEKVKEWYKVTRALGRIEIN